MEEENKYIKKQRIYKTIMLVILTAFITFMVTSVYLGNKLGSSDSTSTNSSSISSLVDSITGGSALQKSLGTIEDKIKEKYLYDIDENKAIEGAIAGYVEALGDPYTEYISSDEMEDYTQSILGNFVGIGIYMIKNTDENRVQVYYPIRESPAEKAGLQAGDLIVKVDGVEYTADDMNTVAAKIKGEAGTKVTLEILRGEETLTFEIERQEIKTNPVYEYQIDENIGYLGVSSFDEGTADDFKTKYLDLKSKGIKSLIIDLRDNGGGIVDEALKILNYIVPNGKEVLITVDKDGNEDITKSENDEVLIDMPIVVLVNASTASASEITAGALKDLGEATIVGSKTYGKGVIQQLLSLTNGGGLKITIEEYYTPNRTKINGVGITPDVAVELETSVTGLPTDTNDTQLNKAIEVLKNQ